MTRRAIFTAVVLSLVAVAAAQTTPWKVYDSSDDEFSALFPSIPDLQKKTVDTPAGTLELRAYVSGAGDTALLVGVCDYGTAGSKDPERMLLGAKNSMLANSGSHVVSEKKITLSAHPGVQFEAENDATHFSGRMYMVDSALYETLVVSPLNKPFDQTDRFLDSFQLITRVKSGK